MKRVLLAIALFGISLTAALFFTATAPDTEVSYQPVVAAKWIEMDPNKPNELKREHVRDETGRHTIDVFVKDGTRIKFVYRASRALESESVTRSDGLETKNVSYGDDGKTVISGFELRVDGSTKWRTETTGDKSVTSAFWADGKLFGSTVVDRKAGKRVTVEHDLGGVMLLQTETDLATRYITRQLEFFSNGKVFRERLTSKDEKGKESIEMLVYRNDGTLEGRQLWKNHQYCDMGGCGESMTIDKAELMSKDGRKVEQVVELSAETVMPRRVLSYMPDGSTVYRELKYDMHLPADSLRVYKTVVRDANDQVVSVVEDQNSSEVFTLDRRFTYGSRFETYNLKVWKALEESVIASQP
jgi:hypothetical protein